MGLPSRITTILQGESLLNDATAITAFRVALAAAVGEGATWAGESASSCSRRSAAGGRLVLMAPLHWLRIHVKEALLQNTLSLLIPFAAYAAAEQVHASGVIAVVVVALYLGTARGRSTSPPASRRKRSGRWSRSSWSPRCSR
ncbi:hypothetical protein GCM10023238_20630 [Streptomyces heliomycini]